MTGFDQDSDESPPRWPAKWLAWTLGQGVASESMQGDLYEEFLARQGRSARLARAWYWGAAFRLGTEWVLARATSRMKQGLRAAGKTMETTGLRNDARVALRGLLRAPGFTAITIGTLALGIGASTAVFTFVDGLLLSPLPFDDADELISVGHGTVRDDNVGLSNGLSLLYAEQAPSIEDIAMHFSPAVTVMADGLPERMAAQRVTPGFFDVLRVNAAIGRTFLQEEGAPDGEAVVVLSDGLWRTNFGGDPSVMGRSLEVDGSLRRIVGVMPPDFGYPDRAARMWLPLQVDPGRAMLSILVPRGLARLAPGATVEGVQAELQGLITRLPELFPEERSAPILLDFGLQARVAPLKETLVSSLTTMLWILLGTVGLVMLIACANVAHLLLVRAEARRREFAVRAAMGAGGMQLLRSYLSESAVLAGIGGLLGAGIAVLGVRAATAQMPASIPRAAEIGVDLRVLAFTGVIVLGCAIFFGLFPLLKYGTADLAGQLRGGGSRGFTGSRERHRLRDGIVVVQMALVLVLLIGSALMFRSVQALRAVDPGFEPDGVLTARIWVPAAEVQDMAEVVVFYRVLRQRLESQPGVEAVGFARGVPFNGRGPNSGVISVEDHPRAQGELPMAYSNPVEPGYFESLGIPLLEGRTLTEGDGAEGARSVVVSKAFAERWWPSQSALGRVIGGGNARSAIVGVVGDARYQKLDLGSEGMVYWPALSGSAENPDDYFRNMDVAIKTAGEAIQFLPVLRREVSALNPRIAVSDARTMEELVAGVAARESFMAAMLSVAACVALLLGVVGIYGVISYVVSQRTREIGVRMALGASAPTVRGMVVRQSMILVALGVGIGLIVAGALSSVMTSLLFGVSGTDPLTYSSVSAALIAVALAASWLPAARAAAVDPSNALRAD